MNNFIFFLVLIFISAAFADVYMQNPRGSNNRYNGNGRNTQNNNRLFDSQNNNAGGYCWGESMYYYGGSHLSIEWTSQHGCGTDGTDCQYILQYMCGSSEDAAEVTIRDGTTTDRIPDDSENYNNMENGAYTYGMHESYGYYQQCKNRNRNLGLWIADRTINGDDSRYTRQNNNANRRGFECPEERDYYPYWMPTPWRDIAILTDDSDKLCEFYVAESQNTKDKYYCNGTENNQKEQISEATCLTEGGKWTRHDRWNIAEPYCGEAPYSRDNHLGNGADGFNLRYNWTIPDEDELDCVEDDSCVCVLRLRYNISTDDTNNWAMEDSLLFVDSTMNGENSPITQDPTVEVAGAKLTLALNTNQYARTFQDRSHVFNIKKAPVSGDIYNLNVRGKRGNIVQTYPATEYDYAPSWLHVPQFSHVHFQWTGCDNNPNGNAGEGTEQTDRSNLVQISSQNKNVPMTEKEIEDEDVPILFDEPEIRQKFAYLDQVPGSCKTYEQLKAQNDDDNNAVEEDVENCFKLNSASRYFDGGLMKFSALNQYHFMSTRNNNFSNRGQKGSIIVTPALGAGVIAILVIAGVAITAGVAVAGSIAFAKAKPNSSFGRSVSSITNHRI